MQRGTAHGPALLPGDPKGSLMLRAHDRRRASRRCRPRTSRGRRPTRSRSSKPGSPRAREGPRARSLPGWRCWSPRSPPQAEVRPIVAMDASRDGRWTAVARDTEVTLYEGTGEKVTRGDRARAADRHASRARSRPCTSRPTASGWWPPRGSRGWAASRRSGTSTTARWSGPSRAIATSSTTPNFPPTAAAWPPAATTRSSRSATPPPASSCGRWKATPGPSTTWPSAPTAASSSAPAPTTPARSGGSRTACGWTPCPSRSRPNTPAGSAPTATRSWPAGPTTTSASGSSSRATSPRSTRW